LCPCEALPFAMQLPKGPSGATAAGAGEACTGGNGCFSRRAISGTPYRPMVQSTVLVRSAGSMVRQAFWIRPRPVRGVDNGSDASAAISASGSGYVRRFDWGHGTAQGSRCQ